MWRVPPEMQQDQASAIRVLERLLRVTLFGTITIYVRTVTVSY